MKSRDRLWERRKIYTVGENVPFGEGREVVDTEDVHLWGDCAL